MSSSCRPRKYHGAFDGFGVLLKSANPSSGARTSAEKISDRRGHDQHRRELDDEQVRPHVHLVLRLGAGLLDRARLDDRQQPLRVTTGPGGGGRRRASRWRSAAAGRRPPPRYGGTARRRPGGRPAALGPLEQVGGDLGAALRSVDVLGRRAVAAAAGASAAGRRPGGRSAAGAASSPPSPPSSPGTGRPSALRRSRLRRSRCSGTSVIGRSHLSTADRRCRRPCGRARSGRP